MFGRIVQDMAPLAQGGEVRRSVVAGIMVEMGTGQYHAGHAHAGEGYPNGGDPPPAW